MKDTSTQYFAEPQKEVDHVTNLLDAVYSVRSARVYLEDVYMLLTGTAVATGSNPATPKENPCLATTLVVCPDEIRDEVSRIDAAAKEIRTILKL